MTKRKPLDKQLSFELYATKMHLAIYKSSPTHSTAKTHSCFKHNVTLQRQIKDIAVDDDLPY
jgi:hypothetical protein